MTIQEALEESCRTGKPVTMPKDFVMKWFGFNSNMPKRCRAYPFCILCNPKQ